jgi:hypothetical protein
LTRGCAASGKPSSRACWRGRSSSAAASSCRTVSSIDRLNELGYAQREYAEKLGEFAIGSGAIAIMPRVPKLKGQDVRVCSRSRGARRGRRQRESGAEAPPPRPPIASSARARHQGGRALVLDAPVLTALGGEREKRRPVALASIPERMTQAVLAIEDRRFYEHPASIRSASSARSLEHPRQARLHRRREHDHAAGGAQRLPAEDVPGMTLQEGAREIAAAQAARECGCR